MPTDIRGILAALITLVVLLALSVLLSLIAFVVWHIIKGDYDEIDW